VSANEYFCSVCGRAIFASGPDVKNRETSTTDIPPFEKPINLQEEESFAAPHHAAGSPRRTEYTGAYGKAAHYKKRRFNIRWGWVVAGILAAVIGLGAYLGYMLFHVPAIKTTPPPGWSDAPELLVDSMRDALDKTYSEAELDYLFCKLEDINMSVEGEYISVSSDTITVAHVKYVLFDSMPETESLQEMQSYLSSQRSLISARLGEEAKLKELEPMMLGCGNVGMYALVSPNGSQSDIEELVVKKKNTLYLVVIAKRSGARFPSEEMEHLSGAITFD